MVTLAGGMESDFSDENDIVFSIGNSSEPSNRKYEEVNSISKPSNVSNDGMNHSNFHHNDDSRTRIPSKFQKNHRNRTISRRRQCYDVKSSQLLDDLRYAVLQGNLDIIKDILSKNIWVDTILKAGWTGLMYACSAGHPEVVEFFLEKKADPNFHKG
ncbi:Ankyrin repeat, SAM and basic leucine zipper domain-containing protein 1, partial [Stegodyphus mimosarum]